MRDKDQEIQESLINFAAYLDANTKVIKKCDDNIGKLEQENKEKDEELARKTKTLRILKAKHERIQKQRDAV